MKEHTRDLIVTALMAGSFSAATGWHYGKHMKKALFVTLVVAVCCLACWRSYRDGKYASDRYWQAHQVKCEQLSEVSCADDFESWPAVEEPDGSYTCYAKGKIRPRIVRRQP